MLKKQNLREFIQIRVNEEEKTFIKLIARKYFKKGVSSLILSLLYDELDRISRFDEELNEKRLKLMEI